MKLLIVTAVSVEADAVGGIAVGVGPAAAAAGTARLLAQDTYDGVISAGIAGGIGVPLGGVVIGRRAIAADLGAQTPDGFLTLDELGFGQTIVPATLRLSVPGAIEGDILTISTVTGTAERLDELKRRYPDAVAEGMEGYGVACAAEQAGVPFAELRAISNPVGPRDRDAWRIGDALAALTRAVKEMNIQY